MVELITFGETPLRFTPPDRQRFELAHQTEMYADGIESNAAIAAHQFGCEALWLSQLPDSSLGRRVLSQVGEHGVETTVSWSDEGRQGLLFQAMGRDPREGNRWHDQDGTAAALATPGDFPMARVQDATLIYTSLSTAVLSEQVESTAEALLRASGGSGAMTAVSLDYAPGLASAARYRTALETLAPQTDVLLTDAGDIQTVLDHDGGSRELANLVATDYGLEIAVVLKDDRSAVALQDAPGTNVMHTRETVGTDYIDSTGQDGAFVGAFLQQLIDGARVADALSHGVAAAALARTIPGPFLRTVAGEFEAIVERVLDVSE